MPFKSKRQLQTCYGKKLATESRGQKFNWNCDEWLRKTPSPNCLPTDISSPRRKCISQKNKNISPIYVGPRGGHFFFVSGVKVYVPRGSEAYAIQKYGRA